MKFGNFVDSENQVIDEITAVYMPKGKSYTGEEQVEIFCHGGQLVVNKILSIIIENGARAAEPGEFSKLAFLNGNISLSKAESVAEIIAASTEKSYSAAREHMLGAYSEHISMLRQQLIEITAEIEASIDYPEEDIDPEDKEALKNKTENLLGALKELIDSYKGGKIVKEGFRVAIAGRPNAGKSSLFNLFLNEQRALVTPTAGTTRDYLSEWIDLGGYKVNIFDTAGLRKSGGKIEKAGIDSSKAIIKKADLILWLFDSSKKGYKKELDEDIKALKKSHKMLIANKIDLVAKSLNLGGDIIQLSCKDKFGFKKLINQIVVEIEKHMPDLTSGVMVTSQRHKQKLSKAVVDIKEALGKFDDNESPELTALDLRSAINAIDEITGKIYNEEILGQIFSKFCVGK